MGEEVGGGVEGGDDIAGVGESVLGWCLHCGGHGVEGVDDNVTRSDDDGM